MNPAPSFNLSLTFVMLVIGLFLMLMQGLFQGLERSRHINVRGVLILAAFAVMGWLTFLAIYANKGFFKDWYSLPPHLLLAPGVPLFSMIALSLMPGFRKMVRSVPRSWAVYPQSFRILMEILLWRLFVEGFLPERMTFEGWNFDVITGLTAIPIAYFCFSRKSLPVRWAISWNIMGLVLLTTIVAIALMSAPFPFQVFTEEPANRVVAHFPWIWLPGFVVPMAYFMHLVSLLQLSDKSNPRS